MADKKYDLSNAQVVGVSVKDPETEKQKRFADEKFRNATPEERQQIAYEDAHKNDPPDDFYDTSNNYFKLLQ